MTSFFDFDSLTWLREKGQFARNRCCNLDIITVWIMHTVCSIYDREFKPWTSRIKTWSSSFRRILSTLFPTTSFQFFVNPSSNKTHWIPDMEDTVTDIWWHKLVFLSALTLMHCPNSLNSLFLFDLAGIFMFFQFVAQWTEHKKSHWMIYTVSTVS